MPTRRAAGARCRAGGGDGAAGARYRVAEGEGAAGARCRMTGGEGAVVARCRTGSSSSMRLLAGAKVLAGGEDGPLAGGATVL